MTQTAFEKLVAAMKAELTRQASEEAGADYAEEGAREWIMTLDGHFDIVKVARAALQALRDPTEEMNEAAKPFRKGVGETAERLFRAMIDTALQERPTQHLAPDDSANTTP